jgi:hypothetical protein
VICRHRRVPQTNARFREETNRRAAGNRPNGPAIRNREYVDMVSGTSSTIHFQWM